ncbi:MAG: putative porin [Clostridium sp.]|nr:putative porin [Prevotella sp.]MCM1428613.1 putative porin [Clostridium sp.]MCM1476190.1 putative porin [Muribaculaceae bacterium]
MIRKISCLIAIIIAIAAFAPTILAQEPRHGGETAVHTFTQPPKREAKAWTLSFPLGMHEKSNIDTLLYNYQRRVIPSLVSDAYATTGNLGAEGLNMIYMNRPAESPFFFDTALDAWITTLSKQKLYNVYTPMTLLSYNFGGNKQNHTDRLNAQFAGNVNRNIGVSAFLDYIYSKGCYESQAVKDFSWGAGFYYTGHRYEVQALYNHLNFLNKENGGITDELYITDPAQVQGGVDRIEPKSIPTRLSATHNRLNGTEFFMTHAYKLGFWDTEQVNDTLTRDVYIPFFRFLYTMKYEDRHRLFINTNATQGQEFWKNHYFNVDKTDENSRYWELTNTIGVEMIEGFRKWAKFGLSAYASYQIRRFRQPTDNLMKLPDSSNGNSGGNTAGENGEESSLTPLPQGISIPPRKNQSLLWVGGRLSKTSGLLLNYTADVKFGLIGDAAGEIDLKGDASTRFKLLGDTAGVAVNVRFSNLNPSWFEREYISNHFIWQNDFGKIRRVRLGGGIDLPWTRTKLSAAVENLQNYVYFDAESMPRQHGGHLQVFAATLEQDFHFGVWNWRNRLTYQATSNSNVLPLPALTIYSNMYLAFKAFRVLDLQIGVDCDYYTKYKGMVYQPATMSFHVQDNDSAIKVGNYAFCNAYITAKLYKTRFYVLWSHFNQGWFSSNYFSMPNYPLNPSRLQFGLCVDFAD